MQSYAAATALCLLVAGLSVGCGAPRSEQTQRPSLQPEGDSLDAADGDVSEDSLRAARGKTPEDSLFALVQAIDAAALLDAFAALPSHTRYVRTEQFTGDGARIAYRERVLEVGPDTSIVRSRDSSGVFDYGYLRPFSTGERAEGDLANLAQHIVPDDPAYVSTRNREAFTYRRMHESLPGYGGVDVIEIRARPETGSDQNIRRARLYVPSGTTQLVALRLERREGALWFRERSDHFLSVRQSPDGRWLPRQFRIETLVRMPFRPTQRFRTVSAFYNFAGGS